MSLLSPYTKCPVRPIWEEVVKTNEGEVHEAQSTAGPAVLQCSITFPFYPNVPSNKVFHFCNSPNRLTSDNNIVSIKGCLILNTYCAHCFCAKGNHCTCSCPPSNSQTKH